jgi:nicotinamide mononucleotide transporter
MSLDDSASPGERPSRRFAAIELTAVVITLVSVWLTADEHVWCWPTGIASGLLYLYVFGRARLYSDVLLQCYFVVTSVYGWYAWTHGGIAHDAALEISHLGVRAGLFWACLAAAGSVGLGWAMRRYTRAALPYWDAVITVLSLIAQYWLTVKIFETWIVWIVVDTMAVGVYLARRLRMTAVLYAILLGLATKGLLEWMR